MSGSETPPTPLDVLAVGAHPDDVELFAGGTLARLVAAGRSVGIVDLTRGESATRGSVETRAIESAEAARILGVAHRENLALPDGALDPYDRDQRRAVAGALRRLRPRLVLTHGPSDRHPDHPAAHELVRAAAFLAGAGGFPALAGRWRVEAMAWFFGNDLHPDPRADWVVDISDFTEKKIEALRAYRTQFLADPDEKGRETYISSPEFWEHLDRRARMWGHLIGVARAEPFLLDRPAHAAHPLIVLTSPAA